MPGTVTTRSRHLEHALMSIAVLDVTKVFLRQTGANPAPAVRGASFELRAGETLGLVGESGSGKSTLARIVLGLLRQTSGRVDFEGRPMDKFGKDDWGDFRHNVQAVFQDPRSSLNWRLRIEDIVTEPLRNYHVGDKKVAPSPGDGATRACECKPEAARTTAA